MQKKQKEWPKGLGWRAFIALAGMIVAMFGNGCAASRRLNQGYVNATIPSMAELEKRSRDEAEPLDESSQAHYERLFLAASRIGRVCTESDTFRQCHEHWRTQPARTYSRVVCAIACGDSSELLTTCVDNDVPRTQPTIGISSSCQQAVHEALRVARENVGVLIVAEREARDRGAADANAALRAVERERDQARRHAEDVERELTALRAAQTQPPTVAIAPETPPRHHGHGAHHDGRHGHDAVATSTPAPAPELNHELNGSGMMCTTAAPQRDGTWLTSCEVRASNDASGSLLARLAGVAGMHASTDITGTERILRPRGTPRISRGVIAQILADNVRRDECGSAIVLGSRPTGWTRGQNYYSQRLGVCDQATNNNGATPTTLASFITDAATHCEATANIEMWGLPGRLIRLRFDREPAMNWQPPPTPTPQPNASLTPQYHRVVTRAIALTTPSLRPTAHRTEVMARNGNSTRVSRGVTLSSTWWLDHRWRYWRPSAVA